MRGETVPFFMKGYKKALPPLEGKGFEGGARELRPVEFPPGCEASDKGPATEFVDAERKTEQVSFSNSWCFELSSSARTTSPFVRSDPGRWHVSPGAWRRTRNFSGKYLRKETARLRDSLFVFLYSFQIIYQIYTLLSRGTTACQCFFSPLTGKFGGLLRGVLLVSPCVI